MSHKTRHLVWYMSSWEDKRRYRAKRTCQLQIHICDIQQSTCGPASSNEKFLVQKRLTIITNVIAFTPSATWEDTRHVWENMTNLQIHLSWLVHKLEKSEEEFFFSPANQFANNDSTLPQIACWSFLPLVDECWALCWQSLMVAGTCNGSIRSQTILCR